MTTSNDEFVSKFLSTGLGKPATESQEKTSHPALIVAVASLWASGKLTNLSYEQDPILSAAAELDKALHYGETLTLLGLSLAFLVNPDSVDRKQLESDLRAMLGRANAHHRP